MQIRCPSAQDHDAHSRSAFAQRADERQAILGTRQAQIGDHHLRRSSAEDLDRRLGVHRRIDFVAGLLKR